MGNTQGLSTTTNATATNGNALTMGALLLVVALLVPVVAPAHVLTQPRPHYIEEIRPVLPATSNGQLVRQQLQQPFLQQIQQPLTPLTASAAAAPLQVPGPRKRAAIVLDKLMFALQKALDEPSVSPQPQPPAPFSPRTLHYPGPLDLQRRGNGDGRLYWRCYFNAVSCF
uniref:Allatostatin-CC n=1 Tax=Gecarcinus lateralis TaxID=6769 RepID=A0AA50EVK0_GECLA|nr:allatostatin-CC [Gecarcinus lateralis]